MTLSLSLFAAVGVLWLVHWTVLKGETSRNRLLLAASLSGAALLHPGFTLVAVALAYVVHRLAGSGRGRAAGVAVGLCLGSLALGRLAPALAARFAAGSWLDRHAVVPLGLSYFVFRLVQVSADRYRGTLKEESFERLLLFVFFLPTLPAGPIATYQRFHARTTTLDGTLSTWGARRLVLGAFKKLFLIGWLFQYVLGDFTSGFLTSTSLEIARTQPASPIAFLFVMFFYAYLDLSAYTDLAVGAGALFGFRLPENFDLPFLRPNLAEFWRSWHQSLSQWCRNQIYFPVFGLTRKPAAALYASMITLGLWHGLTWNWLLWGCYHATGLSLLSQWHRIRPRARFGWIGHAAGIPATWAFVALGYAFVAAPDLKSAWALVSAVVLVGAGGLG